MSSKYQKDVNLWLEFADYDLRCAKEQVSDGFYTAACYHAHQAAEKAFKAALMHFEAALGKLRTHDLRSLLEVLIGQDQQFSSVQKEALTLVKYYITTRYPADLGGPDGMYSEKDAKEAMHAASSILELVLTVRGKSRE